MPFVNNVHIGLIDQIGIADNTGHVQLGRRLDLPPDFHAAGHSFRKRAIGVDHLQHLGRLVTERIGHGGEHICPDMIPAHIQNVQRAGLFDHARHVRAQDRQVRMQIFLRRKNHIDPQPVKLMPGFPGSEIRIDEIQVGDAYPRHSLGVTRNRQVNGNFGLPAAVVAYDDHDAFEIGSHMEVTWHDYPGFGRCVSNRSVCSSLSANGTVILGQGPAGSNKTCLVVSISGFVKDNGRVLGAAADGPRGQLKMQGFHAITGAMEQVKTGLEQFVDSPPKWLSRQRLGLLCNPASVDRRLTHARWLIDRSAPGSLVALYAPQHGFFSEKQDNMIESDNTVDPVLGIPVYSLYGETRIPTEAMMADIDALLIDLQDVGTRVYTFMYSMSHCLEAARRYHKKVIVLDRPNPISGNRIEGNCLSDDNTSFVGRYPIPMRHGLTMGELARLFNDIYGIGCDVTVIPMRGWKRWMYYRDTGLPWVAPSPNLPTPASALVYPGQVLWEGTNLSEGRGTTLPFELFGAPFIDPAQIIDSLGSTRLPGVVLRAAAFEPTWNKWQGRLCRGFQLHVVDRDAYAPYRTTLVLLQAVCSLFKNDFQWKAPPYEYEFEKPPIDLIIGDRHIRKEIERQVPVDRLAASWMDDVAHYQQTIESVLMY